MLDVFLPIKLTIKAPLITQSSSIGAYGLDTVMARTADDRYCYPRTLIKGRLRQSWRELHEADSSFDPPVDDLLGRPSANSSVEPERGHLRFDDFVHAETERDKSLYRIRMDEKRGAADEGAYQEIEAPFDCGDRAEFTGSIRYAARTPEEAKQIRRMIHLGLRWITQLGAERSVGFGLLLNVEIGKARMKSLFLDPARVATSGAEFFDLIINPDAPFCLARRRVTKNIFESERIISGGALKGSLATIWLEALGKTGDIEDDTDPARRELCRNFAKLRFTHAFPAHAEQRTRPVQPPLSLVKCPTPTLYDVALHGKPGLISSTKAPIFSIDWKSDEDVQKRFGWADPPRKLVVRTRIEDNRAKEDNLFAYEMVIPDNYDWYARIDLHAVNASERMAVEAQLRSLLAHGLHGFSKTKATARVRIDEGAIDPHMKSQLAPIDDQWIVTLQTPALLCNPQGLNETSDSENLKQAYAETWDQISNGALELSHYFAAQSLVGGKYLYERFQPGKPYNPFLLTNAGSVFVLKAKTDAAADCIDEWFKYGLPLPAWAGVLYARTGDDGSHWSNCPFLPENGYGEIAVNLPVHWDLDPKGAFHEIQ